MQKEKDTKTTLKQEQKQKEMLLLNDLNYIIESTLSGLELEFEDNLYYVYDYYINNKYDLIEKIFNNIQSLKVEALQEFATNKGFEYRKVLVSKHNINENNDYQIRVLIDDLLKNQINLLIKDYKQQSKSKEFLYKSFIVDEEENKSPPKEKNEFLICGVSVIKFVFALLLAIFEVFGSTKKRR